MPAVVRGGRRQGAASASARAGKGRGRASAPRSAPATPGKIAAIGRLDLSPRAVVVALGAGALVLAAVLATGARAERISASVDQAGDGVMAGLGLTLHRLEVRGASPEAEPAVRRALGLHGGEAITDLDLADLKARAETVGWVKEARVVRLLPDTLLVEVKEHDRLAVWQKGERHYVIDATGRVIPGADARRHPGLPLVVGEGAAEAAGALMPLLAERPRLARRIDAAIRVDQRRWNLRLRDGSLIQLPAVGQEEALIRLDALDARDRLLDLGFERIDLRTPDNLVVRVGGGA